MKEKAKRRSFEREKISAWEKKRIKYYKNKILGKLGEDEGRVMTTRQVADELRIEHPTPGVKGNSEYYLFITAFTKLCGIETKRGQLVKSQIVMAKMKDGDIGYYRKSDEENLVSQGVLGPLYEVTVRPLHEFNSARSG